MNFSSFLKVYQVQKHCFKFVQFLYNSDYYNHYRPCRILDKKPVQQPIFKALIAVAVRDITAKLNSSHSLSSALVMVVGGDWRSNYSIHVPFSTEFCSFSAVGKVSESIFILMHTLFSHQMWRKINTRGTFAQSYKCCTGWHSGFFSPSINLKMKLDRLTGFCKKQALQFWFVLNEIEFQFVYIRSIVLKTVKNYINVWTKMHETKNTST